MPRVLGRNKHQKAAHKPGEKRLGADEIPMLLRMSESADVEERRTAAEFLCPCHVRRRLEPVWSALYRLLEDEDVLVRRAAWHTLEDGGCPDDPVMDRILARTLANERDRRVREFAEKLIGSRQKQEQAVQAVAVRAAPSQRGKCDFCGETNVSVEWDPQTIIPAAAGDRVALICAQCAG